ncbi:MAG: hypothetical protein QM496_07520 [Verrucomicrobiota bacterium]
MNSYFLAVRFFSILGVFAASLNFGFSGELRVFKNSQGKELKAEFISESEGRIRIKRTSDGRMFLLKVSNLSDEDQLWIKEQRQSKKEEKPVSIEGLWGGKWDDEWPVFLAIEKSGDKGGYRVVYSWIENLGNPFSSKVQSGEEQKSYIRSSMLYFRIFEKKLMLYGEFSNPRMANLVRITDKDKNLEDVDLEKNGWEEGAIPASDAIKRITGGVAGK